ncbi:MAG: trehalose-phosphatase [Tepidisphaera sp.]
MCLIPPDLRDRIEAVACAPLLLVVCDYDGTLAEIAMDPAEAAPNERALRAFRECAGVPWTHSAVVSGRSMVDLERFLGKPSAEFTVGSHGAEWQAAGVQLTMAERRTLLGVASAVGAVAEAWAGLRCELKPAGVALHYRRADPDEAMIAMAAAMEKCTRLPGVYVRHGTKVVEFMVLKADKGEAVRRIKQQCGATAVCFVGDDLTDEDVFRSMSAADVSVKVGEGETAAKHRVASVPEVAEVLEMLGERRRAWLSTRKLVKLDECAILSDQRTAAVVSLGGRVSWLCMPRLDSAAIFAELIGESGDGSFEIGPPGGAPPLRCSYDGDSFVLVTEWSGLRLTDYLDCSFGRAYQKAGRVELIRVIEGSSPARIRFAPRLDYGRTATRLRVKDQGLEVEGSNDPIALRSPGVSWSIRSEGIHHTAEAEIIPTGKPVVLELRYGSVNLKPASDDEPDRREQNRRFWSGWARSLKLPSSYPDLVKRSALVLKALSYGPIGTIAAAATTSLPEQFGGVRNWDYRYCWPRDAALSSAALMSLGNTGHALKFLDWVLEVVEREESPDRLRPIYTLSGAHLPPEAELGHLSGFAQSRPVRIGNAASNEVQLDVFAPIVDLVALLAERGAPIAPDHWRLVRAMVRAVETRWMEPDHGIWEMRSERRHHVHSKALCWHTLERALVVQDAIYGERNAEWVRLRDRIRQEVLERGWNASMGTFTGAYDHTYPDASVLMLGLTGLIPREDPRWASTVAFVMSELREGPTVRRYRADDGLPGGEGGMHICTGWLIESLLSVGRTEEAVSLFESFAGMFRSTSILTEQFDPKHGVALGNVAQAYSHLAFINAAVAMERSGITNLGTKA